MPFLLTGILSPDYSDRTGNGISDDDPGEATRFNYSLVTRNYNWRVPFQKNVAYYNPGLESGNGNKNKTGDAKGSYLFGTKEIWYLHSIESKTMLAQFYTANREDALGVPDENGGLPDNNDKSQKQKVLTEIRVYSKSDLMKYGNDAVPVKTVHFQCLLI